MGQDQIWLISDRVTRVRDELERMRDELQGFCRSLTGKSDLADDLTQETLLRAIRHTDSLAQITNLRAWLFRIAVNVFREWWGKQKRHDHHLQVFAAEQPRQLDQSPASVVERIEYLGAIHEFIATLPDNQRRVLTMNLIDGRSHQEIAEQLETSVDNVKSTLYAARKKLLGKFKQSSGDTT